MRLFVAVALSRDVIDAAQAAAGAIQDRLPEPITPRWVTPANLHLTVRFIGHVDEARAAAVLDALRPPLAIAPFDLDLGECGVFPPGGPPRVIWIGLASGVPPLRAMHEEFNRRLAPLAFEPETRPFTVHLTLARLKDVPRTENMAIRDAVRLARPIRARSRVSAATVLESRLSPQGAVYRPLFDVPCTP